MTFGEKVTDYDVFFNGSYGYIIRLNTAPTIQKVRLVQLKSANTISDVLATSVSLEDLMRYPLRDDAPDFAYSLSSGVMYIYFDDTNFPYISDTSFFVVAYRYPNEIISATSKVDVDPRDIELFLSLSIAIAAEFRGKMVPQRTLDKIEYLRSVITLETSTQSPPTAADVLAPTTATRRIRGDDADMAALALELAGSVEVVLFFNTEQDTPYYWNGVEFV